jgi:N-methylhydantoinase A/oxoprolinase/acetone carboxylase beta subunit
MTILLGIDTGGTFTDAVLLDSPADGSRGHVLAKAKALTTRNDFAIGIAEAARQVAHLGKCDPSDIGMVSLSTTLATNALVEGHGGQIALIAIGFDSKDLDNSGLSEALGTDPVVLLPGGHSTHGSEVAPLDTSRLEDVLEELSQTVAGFAVAGYFAVRNPAHELAVRDLILNRTGKTVTCSHELSAKLNGPKRALTTVLNARLIPTISRLIEATRRSLQEQKITAPLMIVRGDGALVSSDFAIRRPIETILSGPAASLVGAHYLTGLDKAVVNDIGGTTSDIAMLDNGRPVLDPLGARVGGFRTMVEAVAIHTFGLGGDSEISLAGPALQPQIALGPRRLIPISLLARNWPEPVHNLLDHHLKSTLISHNDGRFAMRSGMAPEATLSHAERSLYDKITDTPQALDQLLDGTRQRAALNRLVARGLVQIAGLTPSDAMHALGHQTDWDAEAATKALRLFGRQRDGSGKPYCTDPSGLAQTIVISVQRRSAEVVLETVLQRDGMGGADLVDHPLVQDILDRRERQSDAPPKVAEFSLTLDRPLVGLGAPAWAYHPAAGRLLDIDVIVPDHADVANAIGAVVGQIMMKAERIVSQPVEGNYRVSGTGESFADKDAALTMAEKLAFSQAQSLAREAGAQEMETRVTRHIKHATIEGRDMFVEARITATATGRPPLVS